ncbi:MAG: o-succinylbenzoate synthase, partial [Dehalococcoidia bacterium]
AGLVGLGDFAPLPEFGTADVAACARALDGVAPRLAGVGVADAMCAFDDTVPDAALAPLRCAVESACLDVEAQAAGTSVAALLASAPADAVAVNAIAADERDASSVVAAGYRCIKLKVGAATRAEDVARVAALRRAIGPDIQLRLDANGAWSEGEAIAFLREIAAYAIELVEQPVAAGQLGAMRRVREAAGVPVAADEDVTGVEAARRVLEALAADVLIIKPAVVGGLRRAMEIVEMARAAGADVVVTSAMESGVGVAGALHVAAAARVVRACGLGTLELLADDLVSDALRVVDGAMVLPRGAGLGVTLDATALARYAIAPARVVRA